jgi:hypothetical protein|nr:MAG TPA: DNA-directed RNA polymerase [Caudoviricetes sp.]
MVTDDERREVAAKLREPKESLLAYADEELIRLRREVGCAPRQNLYERIADLIDRPTCNDVGDDWEFHCSACGCELDIREMEVGEPTMWKDGAAQVPKYCPSCGAEVVSND